MSCYGCRRFAKPRSRENSGLPGEGHARLLRFRPIARQGLIMKHFLALFVYLFSIAAHADWAVLGGAYRCEKSPQRLTIVATSIASDDSYSIRRGKGFSYFSPGRSTIRCQVGSISLKAEVQLLPPSSNRGMGEGAVEVVIWPRQKNGYPIFNDSALGDLSCADYVDLKCKPNVKIVVEKEVDRDVLTTCTASNSSDYHWTGLSCESRAIVLAPHPSGRR